MSCFCSVLAPLEDKKKVETFLIFIHIPIEPECSEMDNLKKWVVVDLPDSCFQNMIYTPFIVMVVHHSVDKIYGLWGGGNYFKT